MKKSEVRTASRIDASALSLILESFANTRSAATPVTEHKEYRIQNRHESDTSLGRPRTAVQTLYLLVSNASWRIPINPSAFTRPDMG